MKLYDKTIQLINGLFTAKEIKAYMKKTALWPDEGRNQLIFANETAYELGGSGKAGLGGVAITEDKGLVEGDGIYVYGPELAEIQGDMPYARIALIRVKEGSVEDTDHLYKLVRALEYVRYHLYPKGFMMRISAMKNQESVRLRREDLECGLSFQEVGSMFLEAYHKLPEVEAVQLIFVTDPDFDYSEAGHILERSEEITQALDHLTSKVHMDCDACKIQDICKEVEKML